jgi:hypothetical protein
MTTSPVFVTIDIPFEVQTMTRMYRTLLAALLLSGIAIAQPQPASPAKAAAKPAATSAAEGTTGLPTEDTVNAFLFQMFGYDATITWKVTEIRPSEVPGLAEVSIVLTNPKGSNPNRLLVSADGKHVITGEIMPFPRQAGKRRERPRQGTGEGCGDDCRIQRYAVPALCEGRSRD